MNQHLSEDQFAKYLIGAASDAELEHVRQCGECRAEADRFGCSVSLFRSAVRDRVETRMEMRGRLPISCTTEIGRRPLRWAFVTAMLAVVFMAPFLIKRPGPPEAAGKVSTEIDPDALMRAVSLQLSRTIPAPMEPVIALLPTDPSIPQPGGVQ